MTTHEVLVKARALIERKEDWCGDGWTRDGQDRCGIHAVHDALGLPMAWAWTPGKEAAVNALKRTAECGSFASFNDHHTHAEVLAAFDKAITQTAPEPDVSFLNDVREEVPA